MLTDQENSTLDETITRPMLSDQENITLDETEKPSETETLQTQINENTDNRNSRR